MLEWIDPSGLSPSAAASRPLFTHCRAPRSYLVQRILPLARHYVRCNWYIERRSRSEAGVVAQAFVAASRLLLREYTLLVAQV